jgi:CheY-like chemotaxis protein
VPRESPIVLLVDDHEDSAAMYAIGLLAMGFQPITAGTAEDGFERACRLKPDVIVADVSLAGMSGLDLTRRLRTDTRTRGAGIIVLTGHALGGMKDKAEAAGCDRFLVKPCLPDVLALEIRDVLHQREDVR